MNEKNMSPEEEQWVKKMLERTAPQEEIDKTELTRHQLVKRLAHLIFEEKMRINGAKEELDERIIQIQVQRKNVKRLTKKAERRIDRFEKIAHSLKKISALFKK